MSLCHDVIVTIWNWVYEDKRERYQIFTGYAIPKFGGSGNSLYLCIVKYEQHAVSLTAKRLIAEREKPYAPNHTFKIKSQT